MLLQQDLFCCEDVNISVFHTRFDDEPSFFVDSKSQNILVFKTLIRLRKISIYLRAVPPFYDSSQLLRLLQSCSYVTLRLSKFLESDFQVFLLMPRKRKKCYRTSKSFFSSSNKNRNISQVRNGIHNFTVWKRRRSYLNNLIIFCEL